MRIDNLGAANPQFGSEREAGIRPEKTDGNFVFDLAKSQDKQSQDRLNELLDAITRQGKKLGQAPTFSELKSYRDLVRNFLGEIVSRNYALQSQTGWDHRGRQKMYATIKCIDQNLAGLAEDVRVGQERQLKIMGRLDAIRGMLVDLYT